MKQIDRSHLREWIADGKALLLPVEISRSLVEHIERLPWNEVGTRLDWQVIGGICADLAQIDLAKLPKWIQSTAMRNDEYMIFVFNRGEPCIACRSELGITHIDYIYSSCPGMNYFFGAQSREGRIHPLPDHFAEYDGADCLTVRRDSQGLNPATR